MKDDREILAALGALGKQAAEGRAEAHAAAGADPGERARFLRSISTDATGGAPEGRRASGFSAGATPRSHWVLLAAALSLLAGSIVALVLVLRHPSTVEYRIEGAPVASGGFVQAPPDREAVVRFDDGSSVTLSPGARGRVNELRARGARFSVERGDVVVHVAKREGGADYELDAGPYSVRVTGTRFELGWDPESARMHLALTEGSVLVTGPHAEAGVGVSAGQVLDADVAGGLHMHDAAVSTAASAELPAAPPASWTSAANVAPPKPSESVAGDPKRPSWTERVAKGDFAGVLQDAETRGIDATIDGAPLEDVMALADAARYGGEAAVSAKALEGVRRRFSGTRAASNAAFLLGRMAEDSGNASRAMSLYDSVIGEGGAFAAEALGRKMLLTRKARGREAARDIANQYLSSYPKGAYADAARDILKP